MEVSLKGRLALRSKKTHEKKTKQNELKNHYVNTFKIIKTRQTATIDQTAEHSFQGLFYEVRACVPFFRKRA